ncbi:MAG: methyltransferase domain-containing protein [Bacteroidia bacterium]|nr:methyltransferase domain-containing protein [Bacteroidia bacterium]
MNAEWFGSDYYHLLYNHRNSQEAENFILHLTRKLSLPSYARIWDMACGTGRHAEILARLGYNVYATDTSELSINKALTLCSYPNLHFFVHDYKKIFYTNFFDLALNLFTSLGYWSDPMELDKIFYNVSVALKQRNSFFLIDFLNPAFVIKNLVDHEELNKNKVHFIIRRKIEKNPDAVRKIIQVDDLGKRFEYQEWVRLYTPTDFIECAKKFNYHVLNHWGNYELSDFNVDSPRSILLFVKK